MSILQRHVKIVPEVKIVDNCYNSTLEEIVPHVPIVKTCYKSTREKGFRPLKQKLLSKRRKPRLNVRRSGLVVRGLV
jgi:hypothetical protein